MDVSTTPLTTADSAIPYITITAEGGEEEDNIEDAEEPTSLFV